MKSNPFQIEAPDRRGTRAGCILGLRPALGAALLLAAAAITAQAQTWETVDAIDSPPARAYAITADSAGKLFVAGTAKDATGRHHAVVKRSSDRGVTWESVLDVDPGETTPATFFGAIAAANVGASESHLVAAGWIKRVYNAAGASSGQWLVIRSKDGGTSWTVVDEYTHPAYSQVSVAAHPRGVAVDDNGNMFVVGSAEESIVTVKGKTTTTKIVNHWLIRKGITAADGTVQWFTTDLAFPTSKESQRANVLPMAVACVGGNVFVAGGAGTDGNYWRVMKSSDGGTTWTVADNFRLYSGDLPSLAHSIAADSAGNLYVAGAAVTAVQRTTNVNWIVRRGSPDGTNWTTVDQFQYPGGNGWARGVTVTPNGDVHVTGNVRGATNRWFTRKRSAATGSWTTTDDYVHPVNPITYGQAIASDPYGNLFTAGYAAYSSGAFEVWQNWLVRRSLVAP